MFPKFAESGTGGIPRRAFNDPRAMESLGSSNLSAQPRNSLAERWARDSERRNNPLGLPKSTAKPFTPPLAADPNKPPYNNPSESGMTYVRAYEASIALNRLDRRVRDLDNEVRKGNQNAVRDLEVAKRQLADGRSQVNSVPASIIPRGEAVLVPNWTLQGRNLPNGKPSSLRSDRTIKPYGTRTQTKLDVNSYGQGGQVDVG